MRGSMGVSQSWPSPGEDRDEYARFLQEVFLEWAPCDPTENDTVVSMWRKSRLCIYAKAAQARKLYHLFFRRTREPSLDS
jgi:hypothetical protein